MTTDEKLDLILKRWDELEIRLKNLETIVNEIHLLQLVQKNIMVLKSVLHLVK
jgi:hypothetical protein